MPGARYATSKGCLIQRTPAGRITECRKKNGTAVRPRAAAHATARAARPERSPDHRSKVAGTARQRATRRTAPWQHGLEASRGGRRIEPDTAGIAGTGPNQPSRRPDRRHAPNRWAGTSLLPPRQPGTATAATTAGRPGTARPEPPPDDATPGEVGNGFGPWNATCGVPPDTHPVTRCARISINTLTAVKPGGESRHPHRAPLRIVVAEAEISALTARVLFVPHEDIR